MQKTLFLLAARSRLNDSKIKTSPNLTKICRHDHKDLVNIPTKGINDSLHSLRGIDEIPSMNGVFSKRETLKNVDPKELVNPRGFALGKRRRFNTKSSKNYYDLVQQRNSSRN